MAWATMTSADKRKSTLMVKGIATHATIDNSDGRQETMTGKDTTHDTNRTLFQPLLTLVGKSILQCIPPVRSIIIPSTINNSCQKT